MAIDPTGSSYDELPYGDNFFPHTHPDHLAAMGRLFGVATADPASCRVLELGCGSGGNLIPMAHELPGARFSGVDISARQVEDGRAMIGRLGLANLDLEAASIADFDEGSGPYDYIICHGVYSWVPAPIRAKILDILGRCLAPGGLAYLSYNTYPGWHARGMIREMMGYRVRGEASAAGRIAMARDFLDVLNRSLPDQASPYAQILRDEQRVLGKVSDTYLYHEHLEETNHPVYFADLMAEAGARGLRFLVEARSAGTMANLPPAARQALQDWAGDPIEGEQYLDFLCNRTFRRSLLRRAGAGRDVPSIEAVPTLWLSAEVAPTSPGPDVAGEPEEFRKLNGEPGLSTTNPALKAALRAIHDAPSGSIRFADVEAPARRAGAGSETLERDLLLCFLSDLVRFHVRPPPPRVPPSGRPTPHPVARAMAEAGPEVVTGLRRAIKLHDFDRAVFRLLDGRRDEAAIRKTLLASFASGEFTMNQGDRRVADIEAIRRFVRAELGGALDRLAGLGLLVEPAPR